VPSKRLGAPQRLVTARASASCEVAQSPKNPLAQAPPNPVHLRQILRPTGSRGGGAVLAGRGGDAEGAIP